MTPSPYLGGGQCTSQEYIINHIEAIARGEGQLDRRLNDRELEVLSLLCEGKTSAEISKELKLSMHTVNNHRKHIKQKDRQCYHRKAA
ncbi:MAG: helix-turn-helix transcriptional regulator [Bacteroidia bacterium]